ncbi:hypothetical protein K438DRAFT_1789329 [Mycena galopus ATCC 62051]|nr:hypothetical protein K438DRAFT_1789329 [Mycena galopus ATCC 62051]
MSVSKVCKALFDGRLAILQRSCPDVLIYCAAVAFVIRVPWPTINGKSIPPASMGQFLQNNGVFWPCFCNKYSQATSTSCRIVTNTEQTVALCHYEPARCQFFIDLNAIFLTKTSTADKYQPREALALMLAINCEDFSVDWDGSQPIELPEYLGEPGEQV